MLRPVSVADASEIAAIYNHYVVSTVVTFEEEPVSSSAMAERISGVLALGHPYLVAEQEGRVVAYAYASTWKPRSAYRRTAESSIYVRDGHGGRGIGRALYGALIEAARAGGLHALLGGIALPNEASVRLHERLGYRPVGCLREVGFKHGRFVDVGYWERLLAEGSE